MKHLIFLRHGATAGNLERRYIGRTDEPLLTAGSNLHLEADQIFVSPMLRTRQTAELVFPGREYTIVPDLRETDFGLFEGKTAEDLAHCAAYRRWVESGCRDPIPGGEAVSAFKTRCCAAFQWAVSQVPTGAAAAFVIHGGCIMAIMEAFGVPRRDFYAYHIPNGAYLRCELHSDGIHETERCFP